MSWAIGFAWALVVLASLFGWGALVARAVGQRDADLGLQGGWGIAAVCILGGGLVGLGWATQPAVLAVVAVGAFVACARALSPGGEARGEGSYTLLCLVILLAHLALYVSTASLDCADDLMAYLPLVKRMLATGAMDEPFSLRRLAAFGGHSFLQAMVLAVADDRALALAEHGLPPFVVYALALGALRDAPVSPLLRHSVALLLGLGVMTPAINHHSYQTGVVGFLTLARSLALPLAGARRVVLPALVVAGLLSLRAHYLIGIAVLLAVALYRRPLAPAVGRAAGVGALALVLVLPWMWALQRSSGTPFYPILPGYAAHGYQVLSAGLSAEEHLRFLLGFFVSEHAALLWIGTGLAVLGRCRLAIGLAAAGHVTALGFLTKFTLATYWDFGRYVYPLAGASVVLATAGLLRRVGPRLAASERLLAAALVTGALALLWRDGMLARYPLPGPDAAEAAALSQAQAAVPAGARLAVAVNAPYLLDYRRNDAVSLDYPGAAGPPPGLPLGKGGAVLAGYLRAQGIAYLLVQDMTTRYACLWLPPPPEPTQPGAVTIFRDTLHAFMADVAELEQAGGARRFGGFRVIALNGTRS